MQINTFCLIQVNSKTATTPAPKSLAQASSLSGSFLVSGPV